MTTTSQNIQYLAANLPENISKHFNEVALAIGSIDSNTLQEITLTVKAWKDGVLDTPFISKYLKAKARTVFITETNLVKNSFTK